MVFWKSHLEPQQIHGGTLKRIIMRIIVCLPSTSLHKLIDYFSFLSINWGSHLSLYAMFNPHK